MVLTSTPTTSKSHSQQNQTENILT